MAHLDSSAVADTAYGGALSAVTGAPRRDQHYRRNHAGPHSHPLCGGLRGYGPRPDRHRHDKKNRTTDTAWRYRSSLSMRRRMSNLRLPPNRRHSLADVGFRADCFRSTPSSGRGWHPRRMSQVDPELTPEKAISLTNPGSVPRRDAARAPGAAPRYCTGQEEAVSPGLTQTLHMSSRLRSGQVNAAHHVLRRSRASHKTC
jgi:hypothetical protein